MTPQVRGRAVDVAQTASRIAEACGRWAVPAGHMVAMHGSRVEGFANRSSDVDFWVISPAGSPPLLLPVFDFVDGERIQPESLSWDTFESVAKRVNSVSVDATERVIGLTATDLDVYYRFSVSVSVLNGDALSTLKRSFDTSHVASILAKRGEIAAATELARCEVFTAMGDSVEARLCLARAVGWAVDAFLARNGEAYPNRKWRFEKLGRLLGPASATFQGAWGLKACGEMSLEDYRCRCVAFIESLGTPASPRPVSPKIVRGTLLTIAGNHVVIVPSTSVYELDGDDAILWRLCDGRRPIDDLVGTLATAASRSRDEASMRTFRFLREARAHGLLELSPTSE